jgi:heat shock protein HslJ
MGCAEPLMKQDSWLADFLTSKPTITQDGDSLTLTHGATVIVLTDEDVVVPDASLTGTEWTLDSITTGDSVSNVPAGVISSLEFTDAGSLRAQLGCNSGHADYSVSNGSMTVGPLVTTKMACQPPAAEVEAAVTSVLQGQVNFSINGSSLALTPTHVIGNSPNALVYMAD